MWAAATSTSRLRTRPPRRHGAVVESLRRCPSRRPGGSVKREVTRGSGRVERSRSGRCDRSSSSRSSLLAAGAAGLWRPAPRRPRTSPSPSVNVDAHGAAQRRRAPCTDTRTLDFSGTLPLRLLGPTATKGADAHQGARAPAVRRRRPVDRLRPVQAVATPRAPAWRAARRAPMPSRTAATAVRVQLNFELADTARDLQRATTSAEGAAKRLHRHRASCTGSSSARTRRYESRQRERHRAPAAGRDRGQVAPGRMGRLPAR